MVHVINKKTKQPHSFSDEDWKVAIEKGLHTKFKVVEQTTELNKKEVKHFSPPELEKKKTVESEPGKEEKKSGKGVNKNTAG